MNLTSHLSELLDRHAGAPFAWDGVNDCCGFAAEVMQQVHGIPYPYCLGYRNKHQALASIAKHGGLLEAVTHVMGEVPKDACIDKIEQGDLLMTKQADGEWIVGVSVFGLMAVKAEQGIVDWKLSDARYMWRPRTCHRL